MGWASMAMLIVNFYLASHQYLNDRQYPYHFLNFLGALGVMINAFTKGVLAVCFVEIAWGLIALIGLYNVFQNAEKSL